MCPGLGSIVRDGRKDVVVLLGQRRRPMEAVEQPPYALSGAGVGDSKVRIPRVG